MKNNRGFSLVELIIVIAIMAILVGVMAPQLIKYIEKTNVSSDIQLCSSVQSAMVTAMSDPEVLEATDLSQSQIDTLITPTRLDSFTNTVFIRKVSEIVGFDVTNTTLVSDHLRSNPAKDSGVLFVQMESSAGGLAVWICHSDITAKKGDYAAATLSGITSEIIVR